MKVLPRELIQIIDQYCDAETLGSLKLTCRAYYDTLCDRIRHLEVRPFDDSKRLLPRVEMDCTCCNEETSDIKLASNKPYQACGGLSCHKRWFLLNPNKEVCEFVVASPEIFKNLLGTVTSLSITFTHNKWPVEVLNAIVPFVTRVHTVYVSHFGQKVNLKAWKTFIRPFKRMPGIENIQVFHATYGDSIEFAQVLSTTFSKIKFFPLTVFEQDLPLLGDPFFIDHLKAVQSLDLIKVGNNLISAESLSHLLLPLTNLRQLYLRASVDNPKNIQWVPDQLGHLELFYRNHSIEPIQDQGTNGRNLSSINVRSIPITQINGFNLQNVQYFSSSLGGDIGDALLSKLNPNHVQSLRISIDTNISSLLPFRAVLKSLSLDNNDGSEFELFLTKLTNIIFPSLEYICLRISSFERSVDWSNIIHVLASRTALPSLLDIYISAPPKLIREPNIEPMPDTFQVIDRSGNVEQTDDHCIFYKVLCPQRLILNYNR